MLQRFYKDNKKKIDKIIFLTVFILFAYIFVKWIFGIIAPFVVGYIISLIIDPLISMLNKRVKLHRGIGTLILLALFFTLVIFLGAQLFKKMSNEAINLSNNSTKYSQEVMASVVSINDKAMEILSFIPEEYSTATQQFVVNLISDIGKSLGNSAKNFSLVAVGKIPMFTMNLILVIISSFFFTKDKELIHRTVKRYTPLWLSENFVTVRKGLFGALGGYVKAQLIIGSMTASISILGFTIIGFQFSFLIGILVAVFDALPILGSGAILWPWALYNVFLGEYSTAIALMIIYGCIFFTRQFLEPKVLSSQIGLHPLVTLMSIYVGLMLIGTIGFILGPCIVVTVKVILTDKIEISKDTPTDNQIEAATEDSAKAATEVLTENPVSESSEQASVSSSELI